MSKFKLLQTVDLSEFPGWDGCSVVLSEPSVGVITKYKTGLASVEDQNEIADSAIQFIADCFVEGTGFDGKEKIKINKEDITDLPFSVQTKLKDFLILGQRESTTTSSTTVN